MNGVAAIPASVQPWQAWGNDRSAKTGSLGKLADPHNPLP